MVFLESRMTFLFELVSSNVPLVVLTPVTLSRRLSVPVVYFKDRPRFLATFSASSFLWVSAPVTFLSPLCLRSTY